MRKVIIFSALFTLLAAGGVWAAGFRVPEQGAAAMGMANAWVAQADDPSAIFMNPAGIAQLSGPAVSGGFLIIAPGVDHTDVSGKETSLEDRSFFPPNFYATYNSGQSPWSLGVGVSVPFGLGTEWAGDSFARYSSTLTEIKLVNVNPTVACKVNENLMLGLGLDYYNSSVTMDRKMPWGAITFMATGNPAALAIPDGSFDLKGSGDGWGYNAGILYKFGGMYSLGLAFRSEVKVDYEGDATLNNIGGVGLLLQGGTRFKTGGEAELTYPATAQLGFAAQVTPAVLVEADLDWTGWSSYDKLTIKFDDPVVGKTSSTATKDWDDTWCFRLGAKYKATDALVLSAGYLFDQSPIPDENFDTMLPDGETRHGLTVGAGYRVGKFSLDAAYLGLIQTERTISRNNPELPFTDIRGDYEGVTHMFAFNLSYLF